MQAAPRILLVEDDHELVDLLEFSLRRAGFEMIPAYDGPTALDYVDAQPPALVVLDVNLGHGNGFDVLREIRRRHAVPVIMLTASGTEDDKVRGLELGADDYLTKPFGHRELIARIRARLRDVHTTAATRVATGHGARLVVGPLTLSPADHTATRDGRPLDLTAMEFRLLQCLMEHAGAVVPTGTLLRQVWGYDDPEGASVVRVAVNRLRRKLGEAGADQSLIRTVYGVGLMLQTSPRSP